MSLHKVSVFAPFSVQIEGSGEDIPQYQITLVTPAFEKRVYKIGMVGYKDWAGRLIDPRMVPPYETL
jgi:hypothetical protein